MNPRAMDLFCPSPASLCWCGLGYVWIAVSRNRLATNLEHICGATSINQEHLRLASVPAHSVFGLTEVRATCATCGRSLKIALSVQDPFTASGHCRQNLLPSASLRASSISTLPQSQSPVRSSSERSLHPGHRTWVFWLNCVLLLQDLNDLPKMLF